MPFLLKQYVLCCVCRRAFCRSIRLCRLYTVFTCHDRLFCPGKNVNDDAADVEQSTFIYLRNRVYTRDGWRACVLIVRTAEANGSQVQSATMPTFANKPLGFTRRRQFFLLKEAALHALYAYAPRYRSRHLSMVTIESTSTNFLMTSIYTVYRMVCGGAYTCNAMPEMLIDVYDICAEP